MANAKIVNFPFLREGLRKMVFGELSISLIDHATSSVEMMSDLTMHSLVSFSSVPVLGICHLYVKGRKPRSPPASVGCLRGEA